MGRKGIGIRQMSKVQSREAKVRSPRSEACEGWRRCGEIRGGGGLARRVLPEPGDDISAQDLDGPRIVMQPRQGLFAFAGLARLGPCEFSTNQNTTLGPTQ